MGKYLFSTYIFSPPLPFPSLPLQIFLNSCPLSLSSCPVLSSALSLVFSSLRLLCSLLSFVFFSLLHSLYGWERQAAARARQGPAATGARVSRRADLPSLTSGAAAWASRSAAPDLGSEGDGRAAMAAGSGGHSAPYARWQIWRGRRGGSGSSTDDGRSGGGSSVSDDGSSGGGLGRH